MGGGGSRKQGSEGASPDPGPALTPRNEGSQGASLEPAPALPPDGGGDGDATEILMVEQPACEWLPFTKKAIVPVGDHYDIAQFNGRGHAICLGDVAHALPVIFEPTGDSTSFYIRWAEDHELSFEVNFRKMEPGTDLSSWSCRDPASGTVKPEWAVRFLRNDDGTISPKDAPHLVIGAKPQDQQLTLVNSSDAMALKWAVPQAIRAHKALLIAEQQARAGKALAWERRAAATIADAKLRQQLRDDGFLHLPGVAEPEVVATALREINRQLGHAQGGTDAFKAKTFATAAAVTDLFNRSMMPHILKKLLGGDAPYRMSSGQLALRFPGDACVGDGCECPADHFEGVRKGWHIDGCPSDFIPGITDHFGKIQNFDALVGILLSDVPEKLSGELCVYPGSHVALAEYFKQRSHLKDLAAHGMPKLPTGAGTDQLFSRPVVHCTGKAGDCFVANYMTAHFIAPNTAPHIRYAVYFRVHGSRYDKTKWSAPMLDPWLNWPGLSDAAVGAVAEQQKNRSLRAAVDSIEVAHLAAGRASHYQTVDNFHAVQQVHFKR